MSKVFSLIASTLLFFTACNQHQANTNTSIDNASITKAVTEAEEKLFNLLREGKVDDAFAMHLNNDAYLNIRNGETRNHVQMEAVLKANAEKGVSGYNYQVSQRSFLFIDTANVLETILANRLVIASDTSLAETDSVLMSVLWQKANAKWSVAYLSSSTK
jgi:hypothetical protein